ncbi:MAG: F0F1 ATP synthase subunit delta [Thiohalomonadales bacterium]
MAETSTIARPYAQAIFSLAQEESQLAQWSDMLQFCSVVATDSDMRDIIANSLVSKDQLTKLFIEICADVLNDYGKNLVKLLVENHRLAVLAEIAAQFETLKSEAEKTIEAEIVAAYEITAKQKTTITAKLAARLGREVSLTCRIDKTLLGGAIIKAGDMVIDGSTMGQIQKLSVELAN